MSFGIVALIVLVTWAFLSVIVSVTIGGMAKSRDSFGTEPRRSAARAATTDRRRIAS